MVPFWGPLVYVETSNYAFVVFMGTTYIINFHGKHDIHCFNLCYLHWIYKVIIFFCPIRKMSENVSSTKYLCFVIHMIDRIAFWKATICIKRDKCWNRYISCFHHCHPPMHYLVNNEHSQTTRMHILKAWYKELIFPYCTLSTQMLWTRNAH